MVCLDSLRARESTRCAFTRALDWLDFLRANLTVPPIVEFRSVGVHRICTPMHVAMDGQPFVPFPTLDRAHGSLKVRSDFLPGRETLAGRLNTRKRRGRA